MMGQSEILSNSQIIFITLFSKEGCFAFYQPQPAVQLYSAKTNFLSQTHTIWLLSSNFTMQDSHIEHCWRCSHSLHTNHLHTSTNYLAADYFTIYRKGWLACLKPDMDSAVGVHPTQLWFIHNSVMMGFPVDGVLVSVGSLWLLNYVNLLGV
jgi:hypothetical protein